MIKTFKRVERTGRLTAERIICRVRKALIISYSVYNDEHFESIGDWAPPNFVNDKRYL